MIDLLKIEPHEVSSAISGYAIGFYGDPGSGKTSTALQAPKPLMLATEKGYLTHPGTMAVDITSWTDALSAVAQLRKPEVKERFQTIIIDTIDLLVDMGEDYVCQTNGVKTLSDIPWGQ
jgi:GTPase SAR1 family protein